VRTVCALALPASIDKIRLVKAKRFIGSPYR